MKKRSPKPKSFHSRLRAIGHYLAKAEMRGSTKHLAELKERHRVMLRDYYDNLGRPRR